MASLSTSLLTGYESENPATSTENLVQSDRYAYDPALHSGRVPSYPPNMSTPEPFSSSAFRPRIGVETAQKIASLQAKLNKQLGPEYISQRPGPGGGSKLTYAEGWKIINLANEVFGFDGWASSIINLTVDFIDLNEASQRYSVGVTAIVRITLRDGVYHEDIGYGGIENVKQKGAALDKCKKEAVTDAVKRALRNFGNVLGNCLYDKAYTKEVVKMPVPVAKFNKESLHRRPEFNNSTPGASTSKTPPLLPANNTTTRPTLHAPQQQQHQTPAAIPPHMRNTPHATRSNSAGTGKPPSNNAPGLPTPAKTPGPPSRQPPPQAQPAQTKQAPAAQPTENNSNYIQEPSPIAVDEGADELDELDYGAHFDGSDDDFLAGVDLNAESYGIGVNTSVVADVTFMRASPVEASALPVQKHCSKPVSRVESPPQLQLALPPPVPNHNATTSSSPGASSSSESDERGHKETDTAPLRRDASPPKGEQKADTGRAARLRALGLPNGIPSDTTVGKKRSASAAASLETEVDLSRQSGAGGADGAGAGPVGGGFSFRARSSTPIEPRGSDVKRVRR